MKKYISIVSFSIWVTASGAMWGIGMSYGNHILGVIGGISLLIIILMILWSILQRTDKCTKNKNLTLGDKEKEYLEFSFINNSILLKTETINKNGFYEVWRQKKENHFIQILCFNPNTGEFQAFDRFHWSNEPRVVINPPSWFIDEKGNSVHCDPFEEDGVYYEEDLWTPIKFHYTVEWLKEHLQ